MNLILDLDSTLICTFDKEEEEGKENDIFKNLKLFRENSDLKSRIYHFDVALDESDEEWFIWGIIRPGAIEFLKWANSYFDNVLIWSAGTRPYVKEIVTYLFRKAEIKLPNIIFYRDHCTVEKKETIKKLDNLFSYINAKERNITRENTILIDDNDVIHKNNPDNVILIPAYLPDFTTEYIRNDPDDFLWQIQEWYEENFPEPSEMEKINVTLVEKPTFS